MKQSGVIKDSRGTSDEQVVTLDFRGKGNTKQAFAKLGDVTTLSKNSDWQDRFWFHPDDGSRAIGADGVNDVLGLRFAKVINGED